MSGSQGSTISGPDRGRRVSHPPGTVFPLETRAVAIAFFQAISLAVGAAAGPGLFGSLIQTGKREALFLGYAAAAALMTAAAVVEAIFGIDAEQASLEDVAEPLSTRAAHASGSE